MSFFEAVVDTPCTRRVGIVYSNQMKMAYQLLALQLDPNCWDGGKMEDGRGRGREGEGKRDMAEVRQGRKEEARQVGRRTKGRREDPRHGGGREGRPLELS